jgi:hypothetical protein
MVLAIQSSCFVLVAVMSVVTRGVPIPSSHENVRWQGRLLSSPSGSDANYFVWEGVQAELLVTGATSVLMQMISVAQNGKAF